MFLLYAKKNQLLVRRQEPVTSGSVNVYKARFEFSPDWEGLTRTAVFKAGTETKSVLLDITGECEVPWEVLVEHGRQLSVGAYGVQDGQVVLPTVWTDLGVILEGVEGGGGIRPPTPDLYEQILAALQRKGEWLDYDGQMLSLMSGDEALSTVPVASGGGEGGVSDHRLLFGRDAPRQHPIDAIVNLPDELNRIPAPVEPLTNKELEDILK